MSHRYGFVRFLSGPICSATVRDICRDDPTNLSSSPFLTHASPGVDSKISLFNWTCNGKQYSATLEEVDTAVKINSPVHRERLVFD